MFFQPMRFSNLTVALLIAAIIFFPAGCRLSTNTQSETAVDTTVNSNTVITEASPTPQPSPTIERSASNLPVTLPVLDAMFSDENFAGELKSKLGLTDEQIEQLRTVAREATSNLNETETDQDAGSTAVATTRAAEQIRGIIGDEKANQLSALVSQRWERGGEESAVTNGLTMSEQPNAIPTDTRIVVNAPAYRMDLFKDGQLVRSYKIGIGYPEFPLPTGMRQASTIIFNPTWTPPDEPWVKGKIKAGEKVEAGSPLNPLGPIKIPIGLPSLIHGGKQPARLGSFASHGCVGLTNPQVQDVALALGQLTSTELNAEDVANYEKNKTETKNVKLANAIPVELRYETIVVEDGKLKIYRDVYERGTNTEENLRRVLEANGVSFDSLSEQERSQILKGLQQMALDASGNPADPATAPVANSEQNTNVNANKNNKTADSNSSKVTRTIKGQKELTFNIAALVGKGYPAPVDLNTGGKSKRPLNISGAGATNNAAQINSNQNNGNSIDPSKSRRF
jgi:lipoprotein-anchoring transpeptidase ErfK/SrfK